MQEGRCRRRGAGGREVQEGNARRPHFLRRKVKSGQSLVKVTAPWGPSKKLPPATSLGKVLRRPLEGRRHLRPWRPEWAWYICSHFRRESRAGRPLQQELFDLPGASLTDL